MIKFLDFNVANNVELSSILSDYERGDGLYINQFMGETSIFTLSGETVMTFDCEERLIEFFKMSSDEIFSCDLKIGEIFLEENLINEECDLSTAISA